MCYSKNWQEVTKSEEVGCSVVRRCFIKDRHGMQIKKGQSVLQKRGVGCDAVRRGTLISSKDGLDVVQ